MPRKRPQVLGVDLNCSESRIAETSTMDVLVPEPCLQRPGVVAGVGQRVAATVTQHVRMDGERAVSGGHVAAPPSSDINARRLMGAPTQALGPHVTTPLRKKAAVYHSKNCAMMSQMGHNRDYEPNNCRWATRAEQAQNRRLRLKRKTIILRCA